MAASGGPDRAAARGRSPVDVFTEARRAAEAAEALARSPEGLTRTQIRDLCQRNLPADRVEQALHALASAGRAHQERTLTGGRPAELWTTTPAPGA